jgi:hypothetical protein
MDDLGEWRPSETCTPAEPNQGRNGNTRARVPPDGSSSLFAHGLFRSIGICRDARSAAEI